MPTKRKNAQTGVVRKSKNSKKQANPSLNLILKRLDKIDQRLESFERNTAAEFKAVRGEMAQGLNTVRGEMAQGLDAVRGEMAQGLDAVRGEMAQGLDAVRGEMAQGLDAVRGEMAKGVDLLRHEFKTDLQKEFEKYGAKTYPLYARLENKVDAQEVKFDTRHNQLLTAMDTAAKNYQRFDHDSTIIIAEHRELKQDVDILKKRDMEKAAAIEKIEKEVDKLKAA
jgi:hypothetical protein